MNILYLNTTYQCGGAEKVTSQLFQGMKKRGHQVYQIVSYDLSNAKLPEGIHVLYPTLPMRLFNRLITDNHGNRSLHIWYSLRYIRAFIKKHQIDVVHLNNPHDNFLGIRDIKELAELCPLVWTLHDFWALTGHCASPYGCRDLWKEGCTVCGCLGNYPALRKDVAGALFREKQTAFRSHKITYTVPSGWLKHQFESSHLKGLDCFCIYNSLDTGNWNVLEKEKVREKYGIRREEKVIGFIAADPEKKLKGMDHLLGALAKLSNPKEYLLLLAGKESPALQNLEKTFRVRHLGYLHTGRELNEFYAMADLLVNPSVYDTFGLTTIEAMACGTPAAVFPVCAMPEMVDDTCGFLASQVGAEALKDAIEQAFADPKGLKRKGQRSREKVEHLFSEEKMLDQFEELYKKRAAGKRF
ncbi:MAG: glycosyltransferase [Lachnospiraceae bacterium]|nr:glycosyltransferase [Lachnospiraceae bacterium]